VQGRGQISGVGDFFVRAWRSVSGMSWRGSFVRRTFGRIVGLRFVSLVNHRCGKLDHDEKRAEEAPFSIYCSKLSTCVLPKRQTGGDEQNF
jgi:hypothetical protein